MRDVTPSGSNNQNFPFDIKKIINYLIEFVKNPIHHIAQLPDWNWPTLFVIQGLLALFSGILAGILKFNILRIAFGIVIMPLVSGVAALLLTLFLFYYFQFFEKRQIEFRQLFTLVILSSIPFYIFQILSDYFAPITLIGFACTSFLGVVGLCENFKVEKKRAYQLVGLLFTLILISWVMNRR